MLEKKIMARNSLKTRDHYHCLIQIKNVLPFVISSNQMAYVEKGL